MTLAAKIADCIFQKPTNLNVYVLAKVLLVGFSLREKCPNMEFFLVRIFLYSN